MGMFRVRKVVNILFVLCLSIFLFIACGKKDNLKKKKIAEYIEKHQKETASHIDSMESQGTTPRRLIDLIGSLSDLTSGSGDKGTPIIFIQGYFDKYTG